MEDARDRQIKAMVASDIANGFSSSHIILRYDEDVSEVGAIAVEAARANRVDADYRPTMSSRGLVCEVRFIERMR